MPFVTQVLVEKRTGFREEVERFSCDQADVALEQIRLLDGSARSQVFLEGPGKDLCAAGGGAGGRYMVFVAINIDEVFFNLLSPSGSPEEHVEIVVGGQAAPHTMRDTVDLESALRAAAYFFETGDLAPDLTWRRQ